MECQFIVKNSYRDVLSRTREDMSRVDKLGNEPILGAVIQHSFSTSKRENPVVTPGISQDYCLSCKGSENSDGGHIFKTANRILPTAQSLNMQYTVTNLQQREKQKSFTVTAVVKQAMFETKMILLTINKSQELNWFSLMILSCEKEILIA
jgi:hypothetical protein